MLTAKEAKLGLNSPKLIKLRLIGEHKDFLRREDIARFLGPSYSTIYQLIVLYGELPKGDDEEKVERLAGIVEDASTRSRASFSAARPTASSRTGE